MNRVGPLRAVRLLISLRVRRLLNFLTAGLTRRQRPGRRATPGKTRRGWILGITLVVLMAAGMTNWSFDALANLADRAQGIRPPAGVPGTLALRLREAAARPTPPLEPRGATFTLVLLIVAVLLFGLATRELWQPEWDLEWLVTLPMPLSTLLGVRIAERTLVNPTGLLMLWPYLSTVAWAGGHRIAAPFLGLAATLPLLAVIAALRTVIDTGLRATLSVGKLRNLQALLSITGMLAFYFALSIGLSRDTFVLDAADGWPHWGRWLPTGWAIAAASADSVIAGLGGFVALLLGCAVFVGAALALVAWQLRRGVVAAGVRAGVSRESAPAPPQPRGGLLRGIQARELRLLMRDRNFLVQTLIVPAVVFGAQLFLNRGGHSGFGSSFAGLGALAFGITTYTLFFSAFQTLNSEGGALWILYTLPRPLDALLRDKAVFWGAVVSVYPVAILAAGFAVAPAISLDAVAVAVVVLAGVPIYTLIATSLGVLATDPLAQEPRHRVKLRFGYVYMMLAALYTYGIYAEDLWHCLVVMVLTGLVALALWQKARDRLPYLLDPVAQPPARVSLADGLIAAQAFMVLQALLGWVLSRLGIADAGTLLFAGFCTAGVLVFFFTRLVFWRTGALGVPRTLGPRVGRTMLLGLLVGGTAAVAGAGYLELVPELPGVGEILRPQRPSAEAMPWVLGLAVLAAPLFEEFIFRGLVFGGMRRSLRCWPAALASAAIFAIIHPPISFLPVFALGLGTALLYEQTGLLLAPMVAHAVFNAVMLGVQWWR